MKKQRLKISNIITKFDNLDPSQRGRKPYNSKEVNYYLNNAKQYVKRLEKIQPQFLNDTQRSIYNIKQNIARNLKEEINYLTTERTRYGDKTYTLLETFKRIENLKAIIPKKLNDKKASKFLYALEIHNANNWKSFSGVPRFDFNSRIRSGWKAGALLTQLIDEWKENYEENGKEELSNFNNRKKSFNKASNNELINSLAVIDKLIRGYK